jgi:hypothetical protein
MTPMVNTMNYRAVGAVAAAAAIAFAQPAIYLAQEANKAVEIIAAARKAIGDKKLDALKTFSVEAGLQRNMNNAQISSDIEIVLDLPDKYLRQETPLGGGMMIAGGGLSGFNGSRPLQKINFGGGPGGMVIRMGGPGGAPAGSGEKPTPEQLEQMTKTLVRNGQVEASRLMLGWFAAAHPAVNAQYTYAGEAESPDGKAYVIDVKNADNFTARLFIDQQTSLPLMVTYKGPQPRLLTAGGAPAAATAAGGHVVRSQAPPRELTDEERKKLQADAEKQMQEMQRQAPALVDFALYFEDWRDAEGVKFPFKMRRAIAGTTTEEWTVTRIKVNPKVDPKRFAGDS